MDGDSVVCKTSERLSTDEEAQLKREDQDASSRPRCASETACAEGAGSNTGFNSAPWKSTDTQLGG